MGTMPADRGRWLAIDWGERRIGLAISDPSGVTARPAGGGFGRAGAPTPRTHRKGSRRGGRVTTALLVASVVSAAVVASCRGAGTGEARVIIPRGSTLRVAADSLQRHGVIQSATAFRLYALLRRGDR